MKMNNWRILSLALAMPLLISCEKKEQEISPETMVVERSPSIVAYYKNVNPGDLFGFIIALDRTTHVARDTFYRHPIAPPSAVRIDKTVVNLLYGQTNQLKDFDYVLHYNGRLDTIRNVSYEQYMPRGDCLSCGTDENRLVLLSDYKNLTFTYQGKTYTEQDSLILN